MTSTRPPVAALVIFDGWGVSAGRASNAIAKAKTPTMDRLYAIAAHTELDSSGEAVGLPPHVMGNSEVGHLTIGSGRVIYQDLMRLTKASERGGVARARGGGEIVGGRQERRIRDPACDR